MSSARRVASFAVCVCLVAPNARATTYLWRGLSSGTLGADGVTYDLAANWLPAVIPSSSDFATFDIVGVSVPPLHLQVGRSVGTLTVAGTTVSLDNTVPLNPGIVSLGSASGAGTLSLVAGTMSSATWRIGDAGAGTVNVLSGAHVVSSSASVGMGATGTLHVEGSSSSWTQTSTLTVGSGTALGQVEVVGGGALSTAGVAGNNASMTISGSGSTWTDTGMLQTTNGPSITAGAIVQSATVDLESASGTGQGALVSGAGSEWHMGSLSVGRTGLSVEAGGLLTVGIQMYVGESGGFSPASVMGDGSVLELHGPVLVGAAGQGYLGAELGGRLETTGTVFLGGGFPGTCALQWGSTWTYSSIDIGTGGSTGSFYVDSGSLAEGPGIALGGGSATVSVTGTGSRWHITGNQSAGPLNVDVGSGGTIQCDGTLFVNSQGRVDVDDRGTLIADQIELSCLSNGVTYPFKASGTVRTNHMKYDCTPQSMGFDRFELGIASGSGSGQYTVPAGNSLQGSHHVFGYDAPATVTVIGSLSVDDLVLGDQPTASATCTIFGTGQTTGDATVGKQGAGTLVLSAGITTVGRDLVLGEEPGSSGNVKVVNGNLTVAGDAFIGGSRAGAGGSGRFLHSGNGTSTITDTLFVFPADTLLISSGQLSAAVIDLLGGALKSRAHITGKIINEGLFSCAPDTFRFAAASLTGDFEQHSQGVMQLRILSLSQHDSLTVTGTMSMAGTLALVMDPPLIPRNGDRIRLATAGVLSGQFEHVTGLVTGWSLQSDGTSLFLMGSCPECPATDTAGRFIIASLLMLGGLRSLSRAGGRRALTAGRD